jgi:hypothetical protein
MRDVKTCLKHGRPLMITRGATTMTLPSDRNEVAAFNRSSLMQATLSVTWLTYNLQLKALHMLALDVYDTLSV